MRQTVDVSHQLQAFLDDNRDERFTRRQLSRGVRGPKRIAAAYALDDFAMHDRRGPLSVRWMNAHMIEELARHAGHGDILREQILETEGWAV